MHLSVDSDRVCYKMYICHNTDFGQSKVVFLTYHFFFFNDTATTEIYTLSLHDALPILENVRLWSAETPYLYRLTINAGDEVIGEEIGFREIGRAHV